ncbi:trichohyalin-like [Watersipora subatra]|uniref:trichohyalin-like n=1 Tax=Watersipora subatra TaxID=2589382 RepID=UPI00355B43A3
MAGLAACETEELRERREQQELMRIQRGKRRLWREGQFGAAAILLKMLGRKEWSETEAREMQVALARERLADRKNAARDKTREEDALLPETGNVITIMEVVLHEMDLKHMEERDALLTLMEENAGSPHYQQSLASDQSHLESRLTDLSEERRRMRDSAIFDSKEQNALLQEGVCHKLRLRVLSLAEDGEDNSETEAAVTLLADLQQLQEQEMFGLYSTLQHKSVNSLRELRGSQEKARNKCWYDHLATAVLTAATITEALNPEQELITVLGQKYDALKDKLILEGLMNQVSEAEWQALSQKQRQQKLRDFKLQEKKLREDGKLDEAKQLMSDLLDADQGIDRIKADQERLLKEKRDALKKKLKTNPEDSEKLEEELNKVEEKLMKKSVLDNLSYEYEDEKERLLALLHSQQDDAMAERLKQLEMAKLRRQKRILQKEGELDEASALIHLSQKNEENRLAGLSSDKQLQMELARRRLEVRRAKAGTTEAEIPSTPTALAGVQDRVLEVLASKHSIERDILINYFMVVEEEDSLEHVLHISNVKLRKALQDLENQCKGLQTVCQTQTGNCAKEKSDLVKLLNKAFLYHLTVLLRASYGEDGSVYTLERVRETCTSLLASLQESQDSEAASTSELMINEEDSVLEKLLDAYNISIDKGQYNNLISSLFAILDDEHKWTAQQVDLDEKFEAQKQELLDAHLLTRKQMDVDSAENRGEDVITKDGHEVEVEALLKQLEAEHSAQKAAVAKQMERQNEMMLERRRAKKQARFAEDVSVAKRLLEEATANDLSHKNAHEQEQGRQGDLMSERLAKRKAERNRREAQEKKEELERFVRPKTVKDAFGNVINYMPPMMALRRERTVVEVSDEQKDKEWQKLVKETHRAELTRSQEQRRQEEMVRARRQQKQLRRHSEVEAIFSIGEKQKTMFERSNREDREQQVSKMKERIARIKNEKTMMAKPTRKSTSFEHLVDTSKGGSKDEQMKALAANLQKRFDDESQGVREGRASLAIGKEGAAETEQPTRILSLEEKQRILKERRLAKRKNKEAAAADPPPAE